MRRSVIIFVGFFLTVSFVDRVYAACPFSGVQAEENEGEGTEKKRCLREKLMLLRTESFKSKTPPDDGQKTFDGCTCSSSCGTSVDDLETCDWCYTEDSCGKRGLTGHYDYCAYPEISDFEHQTFQEKHDFIWNKINEDTNRKSDYSSPLSILTESIRTSFDNFRDYMPAGRVKGIHSIGVICDFELDIDSASTYTGLFQSGKQIGFVRMGSAADPVENKGITPGLGIKFLRSGVHSGNYVALHSLALGQSWDFFAYNMSNHISAPDDFVTKQLAKKFQQASQCAPQVGLSDMARFSQDGTEHTEPKFPFKLFLIPRVQTPAKEKTIDEINAEMMAFKAGTTLFTVYACDSASAGDAELTPTDGGLEAACADPIRLGDMIVKSQCTTSKYGDEKFFIRHQRIEDDWKLRPDFLSSYDAAKACGWSGAITADGAPPKCS